MVSELQILVRLTEMSFGYPSGGHFWGSKNGVKNDPKNDPFLDPYIQGLGGKNGGNGPKGVKKGVQKVTQKGTPILDPLPRALTGKQDVRARVRQNG